MKYFCCIFLFCCIQSLSFGQTIIKGKILNKKNNDPISYVNIGIPKHAEGTVSDEDGNFHLKFKDSNDTVIISAIGFFTIKKSVNELLQNGEILLQPQIHEIKEVNFHSHG